jgi:hypothetical protein
MTLFFDAPGVSACVDTRISLHTKYERVIGRSMELLLDVRSHASFVEPMFIFNQLRFKDDDGGVNTLPPEVIRQIVR